MARVMPEGIRPRYPRPRQPLAVLMGPRVIDWQAAIHAAKQRGVTGPRLWALITARLAVLMALIRLRARHTVHGAMDQQASLESVALNSLEELEIDDNLASVLANELTRGDNGNGLKINVNVDRGEVSIAQEPNENVSVDSNTYQDAE